MHVEQALRTNSNRPAAEVPSLQEPGFREALEAFIAWAQGRGPNPGVAGDRSFSTAVLNARFSVRGAAVDIKLPPGSTYKDVAEFMDQAVDFAAHASGLE